MHLFLGQMILRLVHVSCLFRTLAIYCKRRRNNSGRSKLISSLADSLSCGFREIYFASDCQPRNLPIEISNQSVIFLRYGVSGN